MDLQLKSFARLRRRLSFPGPKMSMQQDILSHITGPAMTSTMQVTDQVMTEQYRVTVRSPMRTDQVTSSDQVPIWIHNPSRCITCRKTMRKCRCRYLPALVTPDENMQLHMEREARKQEVERKMCHDLKNEVEVQICQVLDKFMLEPVTGYEAYVDETWEELSSHIRIHMQQVTGKMDEEELNERFKYLMTIMPKVLQGRIVVLRSNQDRTPEEIKNHSDLQKMQGKLRFWAKDKVAKGLEEFGVWKRFGLLNTHFLFVL